MKPLHLILSFTLAGAAFAGVSHALRQEGGGMDFGMPKAGKEHQLLAAMEGKWDATVLMMGQETSGTSVNTMEMDGMWLVSRFTGEMMGSEFSGLGLMGYDPGKGKYVGVWVDSMTPSIEPSQGTYDAEKKEFTMTQKSLNPMTGEEVEMVQTTRIQDRDHHTFTLSMVGPGGESMDMMSVEYEREK